MDYQIRTYKEDFIEEQFKIGSATYDYWPMGGQTRPDQLRQAYTAEGFDPETRFYAFSGEEMVGFLTSSYNEEKDNRHYYFFESPYVKPGHEEAERLLLDYSIDQLKVKGADVLVLRAGEYWGKSEFWAKEYGFEFREDIVRRGELDVMKADFSNVPDAPEIENFAFDKHVDGLIEFFAARFGMPEEQVRQSIERWKDLKEGDEIKTPWDQPMTLLATYIAVADDKVVGRATGFAMRNFGPHTMTLNQFTFKEGYEHLKAPMMKRVVEKARSNNKNKIIIHTGLWGLNPSDEFFAEFGLEFESKLAYYEKNLS